MAPKFIEYKKLKAQSRRIDESQADDMQKYVKDRGVMMWNIATEPRYDIGNNKKFTSMMDVRIPFPIVNS